MSFFRSMLVLVVIGIVLVTISQSFAYKINNGIDGEAALLTIGLILGGLGAVGSIRSYDIKRGKKLFRDTDDRIIGGVCSGIGHYLKVKPLWIRLISVLIVFLWGFGLVICIIWLE